MEGGHEDVYHYFRLGYNYYELKNMMKRYLKAIELKPDYAEAYNMGAVDKEYK
ncbi:MAG TPA: hypothetical protein VK469_15830 [Candidatus Kapabacteria bacterium]|nr:hypothetical protein [Candidatus Kapabacteria bacterium]